MRRVGVLEDGGLVEDKYNPLLLGMAQEPPATGTPAGCRASVPRRRCSPAAGYGQPIDVLAATSLVLAGFGSDSGKVHLAAAAQRHRQRLEKSCSDPAGSAAARQPHPTTTGGT